MVNSRAFFLLACLDVDAEWMNGFGGWLFVLCGGPKRATVKGSHDEVGSSVVRYVSITFVHDSKIWQIFACGHHRICFSFHYPFIYNCPRDQKDIVHADCQRHHAPTIIHTPRKKRNGGRRKPPRKRARRASPQQNNAAPLLHSPLFSLFFCLDEKQAFTSSFRPCCG